MAAKVIKRPGAWWLVIHDQGDRHETRIGPSDADRNLAELAAERSNGEIRARELAKKLGLPALARARAPEPTPAPAAPAPLPIDAALRRWHATYRPTFKPSFADESLAQIERHLVPYFGARDLRELRETPGGLAPSPDFASAGDP